MARPCPICGAKDGTCGDQPLAFAPFDPFGDLAPNSKGVPVAADEKVYLPKQATTRGVPGYRGDNIVVVDPETGKEDKAATSAAKKSTAEHDREQAAVTKRAEEARATTEVVTTRSRTASSSTAKKAEGKTDTSGESDGGGE